MSKIFCNMFSEGSKVVLHCSCLGKQAELSKKRVQNIFDSVMLFPVQRAAKFSFCFAKHHPGSAKQKYTQPGKRNLADLCRLLEKSSKCSLIQAEMSLNCVGAP